MREPLPAPSGLPSAPEGDAERSELAAPVSDGEPVDDVHVEMEAAAGVVGRSPVVRRRQRRRQVVARPHAVFVRLSEEEFAVLGVAAATSGVTVTSFVGAQAVAVARGVVHPLPSAVGDVVRELVAARTQLVRYGVLLNQALARLHATGAFDAGLVRAAQRCDAAVAAVRGATERLGRST